MNKIIEETIRRLESLKHTGYDADFVSWEDVMDIRDWLEKQKQG